jgi:hypothetical protein
MEVKKIKERFWVPPSQKKLFLIFCVRLSVCCPSTSSSILSFRQVQIHSQNQDWMHGLEVRDDFSFRRKKKGKKT